MREEKALCANSWDALNVPYCCLHLTITSDRRRSIISWTKIVQTNLRFCGCNSRWFPCGAWDIMVVDLDKQVWVNHEEIIGIFNVIFSFGSMAKAQLVPIPIAGETRRLAPEDWWWLVTNWCLSALPSSLAEGCIFCSWEGLSGITVPLLFPN